MTVTAPVNVHELPLSELDAVDTWYHKSDIRFWATDDGRYFITSLAPADDKYPETELALMPTTHLGEWLGFYDTRLDGATDHEAMITGAGFHITSVLAGSATE